MEKDIKNHLFAVILAGGGGTRLWPRSTNAKPKQFLRLVSDYTMIQETYRRIKPLIPKERILVVTNEKYMKVVRENLPELPDKNIIGEPIKRDSAMAMGLGTVMAQKLDEKAIIINLAADHVVKNGIEFQQTILIAAQAAASGDYLVAIGIKPTFPHTGFGYIKIGEKLSVVDSLPVYRVDSFTEKPQLAKAKEMLNIGKYYWNANMYVWTAQSAMTAFERFLPNSYHKLQKIKEALGTDQEKTILKSTYDVVETISIDYAISEKAHNLLLIPGDFGWSDIGDWQVVYELSQKDQNGNVIDKSRNYPPIIFETKNCFINGGKKLLAIIGINDLIVVETKKTLLIVPRSRAQDVKQIVTLLKEKNLFEYL